MTYDDNDVQSLALVAWKEARGEHSACAAQGLDPNAGMQAVMNICVNRVGTPGFAHTIHDVIYGKNQFTSMSVPSDPEFNLQPPDGDQQYSWCLTMAPSILEGSAADITSGAHYYANLKYASSGWFFDHIVQDAANHPQTTVIGHQTFFK